MSFRRLRYVFLICALISVGLCVAGLKKTPTSGQDGTDLASAVFTIDYILIEKQERKMSVFHRGKLLKTYTVALGSKPVGHKIQEGDGKTPEGKHTISAKNANSQFYRSLRISYPSPQDHKNAKIKGVNPGGDIMIHGLRPGMSWLGGLHRTVDWTKGCIALTNKEMDEISPHVVVGTVVEIVP